MPTWQEALSPIRSIGDRAQSRIDPYLWTMPTYDIA